MGCKNSVVLAQHVHRFVVKQALSQVPTRSGEAELRKDRAFPSTDRMYRIYLDNFDQLEKVSSEMAATIQGSPSKYPNRTPGRSGGKSKERGLELK